MANQLALQTAHTEPPSVVKARQFIGAHHEEDLTLADVARAVNMSTFYFCKTFKKATGMRFANIRTAKGNSRVSRADSRE